MTEENKPQQKEIKIQMPPDHKPTYANSVKINVTDEEVLLQFAYLRPDQGTGVLIGDIVLSPKHAMRFQKALDETLKKHFTRHLPQE
jgi:ssRNA-specific RNase YbeY (16S rRNA maturation enzyme)